MEKRDTKMTREEGKTVYKFICFTLTDTNAYLRGGWSHNDTSEPGDGYGAQNMVIVQFGLEPATFQSLARRANQLR
jgi:hypothetical protein